MNKLVVRIYMGKKHLSLSSTGATFEEIEDLQNVMSIPEPTSDDDETYTAVTVAGVQQLETNLTCVNCKRILASTADSVCVCDSCKTIQKPMNQRYTAKLFITNTANQRLSLRAYHDALKSIADADKDIIDAKDLLFAPPFDVTFNKYHTITNISRK